MEVDSSTLIQIRILLQVVVHHTLDLAFRRFLAPVSLVPLIASTGGPTIPPATFLSVNRWHPIWRYPSPTVATPRVIVCTMLHRRLMFLPNATVFRTPPSAGVAPLVMCKSAPEASAVIWQQVHQVIVGSVQHVRTGCVEPVRRVGRD